MLNDIRIRIDENDDELFQLPPGQIDVFFHFLNQLIILAEDDAVESCAIDIYDAAPAIITTERLGLVMYQRPPYDEDDNFGPIQ